MDEQTAQGGILLIDDDDFVAGSLRQYLWTQGFAADVALDTSFGEALMRANDYRVVVVDPYLTTRVRNEEHAVIDKVIALQPNASVFVLTAYASEPLLRLADDGRVSAVIPKPQGVVPLGQRILRAAAALPLPIV
jgi:ActR/RegA family two-component response regulator